MFDTFGPWIVEILVTEAMINQATEASFDCLVQFWISYDFLASYF